MNIEMLNLRCSQLGPGDSFTVKKDQVYKIFNPYGHPDDTFNTNFAVFLKDKKCIFCYEEDDDLKIKRFA